MPSPMARRWMGSTRSLASYENSPHEGETPADTLRVIQWGDSHTAADMFTGGTRLFRRQFGDGGIGYVYAGHPFAGYPIFDLPNQRSLRVRRQTATSFCNWEMANLEWGASVLQQIAGRIGHT